MTENSPKDIKNLSKDCNLIENPKFLREIYLLIENQGNSSIAIKGYII